MARRPSDSLIFDSLRLEGGLFVPAVLEKAARGDHTAQKAPDYQLPKGLSLVDEQGRAFRIASALWKNFEATRARHDIDAARAIVAFASEFFRDALGYTDFTPVAVPIELTGRGYPITALACGGRVPVIIAPHALDLDTPDERFAIVDSGLRRRSAYQLAQQFLNASAPSTWALLTNGRQLRLVRDAETLARPAFLEADLELILKNQRYADFAAVWRLFHASRAGAPATPGDTCVWETWKLEGQEQGERVRDGLRGGVTEALIALGTGFIEHRDNEPLRLALQSGDLRVGDYLQQLFRLIYRCLFLFTVEERGLLHVTDDSPEARRARDAYAQGYSFRRLRDRALRRAGFDRHHDLWTGVLVVFRGLARGEPRLALPGLGGLFAPNQCPGLDAASLENRVLLTAMRHLRWSAASGQLAAIDYRNMDSEELGSVYESLLELVPTVDLPSRRFGFVGLTDAGSTAGNARKTSGSYYTSDSLVQELIRSALDPVITQKVAAYPGNPVDALLALTVCDPSCGSGHFLLAAARRLAEKIAELRAPDGAVRPEDYRHALREVASHCLFGVDLNPMAVELCRVALWLETVDPGKPLGFLNHHIRHGNSLIGATPELIAQGLPDETFTAIDGDDKAACSELRKRNKNEREGFGPLFQQEEQSIRDRLRHAASAIEEMDDSQADLLQRKEAAFASTETAPEYRHAKLLADLWCAAFVIEKHYPAGHSSTLVEPSSPTSTAPAIEGQLLQTQDELFGQELPADEPANTKKTKAKPEISKVDRGLPVGVTTQHLRDFVQGRPLSSELQTETEALARKYSFFHWHLAFPTVFARGGFDCILGNPPWDALSPDQREFFGKWVSGLRSMAPDIQQAQIDTLLRSPAIAAEWETHCHDLFELVHFLKNSGVFTLYAEGNLGKGDFNVYRTFIEVAVRRVRPGGYAALVVPGGLYGGANASAIRKHLIDECELQRVYGLINTKRGWFKHVDIDRFAAFVAKRGGRTDRFNVQFGLSAPADLVNPPVEMDAEIIRKSAPNTYAIPDVRDVAQLGTNAKLYAAWPAFGATDVGPPVRHYSAELHMGSNRTLFTTDTSGLPVYEGRMIDHFDHRAKTYNSGHGNSAVWIEREFGDPAKAIAPQWRVLRDKIPSKLGNRCDRYRIGFGDVANPRNQRSFVSTLIPPNTICGHKVPTLVFDQHHEWAYLPWLAVANSFAMDWLSRTRLTAPTMSFTLLDSLPFPRPAFTDQIVKDVAPLVLRLVCTAPEMTAFWNRMAVLGLVSACAPNETPQSALLEPEERMQARAYLDAYVGQRVFGLTRQEISDILDTFDAYRNADMRAHQEYRTKRLILAAWDGLAMSDKKSTAPTMPIPPRVPFSAENISHYLQFLVYAWIQKANGNADLRTVVRAFSLLREPQRITSQLKGSDQRVDAWRKSFREPIQGATLRPILDVLRDRKSVRVVAAKGGALTLGFPDGSAPVTIPVGIELDAEFSLRAAQQELDGEKPLIAVEQSEYNYFLAHAS
ncbi:MAG: hypothetical protein B9S35_15430 [Opitutia bacterium Tous-C5TDCM]|nr:MAG: hypothetical protein B9S35_15430 [Opitutae bacterium Tous-C5TDCM]